jgi:hypothetical protein
MFLTVTNTSPIAIMGIKCNTLIRPIFLMGQMDSQRGISAYTPNCLRYWLGATPVWRSNSSRKKATS